MKIFDFFFLSSEFFDLSGISHDFLQNIPLQKRWLNVSFFIVHWMTKMSFNTLRVWSLSLARCNGSSQKQTPPCYPGGFCGTQNVYQIAVPENRCWACVVPYYTRTFEKSRASFLVRERCTICHASCHGYFTHHFPSSTKGRFLVHELIRFFPPAVLLVYNVFGCFEKWNTLVVRKCAPTTFGTKRFVGYCNLNHNCSLILSATLF